MTQEITIRESHEKFTIDDMVYPFPEAGIYYLRVILVDEQGKPEGFLILAPQDILYRRLPYSAELMRDVKIASAEATKQQQEYMEAVEEEMRMKAEATAKEENGEHTDDELDSYYR